MSLNSSMHREAFDLLCDRQIGRGMSRTVFSSKILPDCVIKIEEESGRFQNIVEWETWQRVKFSPLSRWFAECKWISPNGSVLIMERTKPASLKDYLKKMPAFLCDFKRSNYGMAGDWLVCHDYGTNLLFEFGMTKRLVNANWIDES